MNNIQRIAFDSANSGNAAFTAQDSMALIIGVIGVIALIWFCWVAISSYSSFGAGKAPGNAMFGHVTRALFVLIITLVVISY